MKYLVLALVFAAGFLAAQLSGPTAAADPKPAPPAGRDAKLANPSIDFNGYLKVAAEAESHRRTRRVTEDEFVKMMGEKDTIVLDARSKEMFDLLHVRGAVNLSFPDIDAVSLPKLLPDKNARILIYCNNNFTPAAPPGGIAVPVAPAQPSTAALVPGKQPAVADVAKAAFRPKSAIASLNISTYTALYSYGYRNVFELAPLLDPAKSKIAFESDTKK